MLIISTVLISYIQKIFLNGVRDYSVSYEILLYAHFRKVDKGFFDWQMH